MSDTNDTSLALEALHRAVRSRAGVPPGLVHHTDRGSPYASDDYRKALSKYAMVASMSRKGDCWDNAVAESFFATIKGEMTDDRVFETRAEAHVAIGDYIDAFCNVTRLHSTIGYVSPIEFELNLKSRREAA
jgi:transposase InsO family protein